MPADKPRHISHLEHERSCEHVDPKAVPLSRVPSLQAVHVLHAIEGQRLLQETRWLELTKK